MSEDGRVTRLYGSIDIPDDIPSDSVDYPPTIAESGAILAQTGLAIGDTLERYRIEDVLGRGGMGEVLSARDEQLGRAVAIKRLRIENPSPEILERFLREVRIQGRLEHPAVVPVHELHTEGEKPFFVMKQVAGTTLAEVIERLARGEKAALAAFPRQRLLRAFVEVCLAIEFAHTRGVVHRDLKPANIVLGDFGEVYVLDWGIARVADEHGDTRSSFADIDNRTTVDGQILGTPGYIAPEQIAHDKRLDGRADVYSLGCILFEILALESLHPRGQGAIASALTMGNARPSARTPNRDIEPELDEICVKATTLRREERYPTARMLADAVAAFLDGNRDNALRNELARAELDTATKALASGTTQGRRDAMRAAARAIALDPTYRPAADLVGHLMLEPPKDMPPEVDAQLADLDVAAIRRSARFGIYAALAYPIFWAMLFWAGFRDTWYLVAAPCISAVIIIANAFLARRWFYWPRYVAIFSNVAMFSLFAIVVSPVIMGPAPAIIMIMLLAAQRRLVSIWVVAILTALAVVSPWLLQLAGVIDDVVTVEGSNVVLHTMAGELDIAKVVIGLVFYCVVMAQLAALMARSQDDDRRNARRTMQLQTWQLQQLVPRPTTIPPR